jgi:arylsulfatase B
MPRCCALHARPHRWDCGYHTAHHTPSKRGFDSFVGYYNADEDYITHDCGGCSCPGGGLDLHNDSASQGLTLLQDSTTYSTTLYTAAIIDEISKAPTCAGGDPTAPNFFVYAAYQAVRIHG